MRNLARVFTRWNSSHHYTYEDVTCQDSPWPGLWRSNGTTPPWAASHNLGKHTPCKTLRIEQPKCGTEASYLETSSWVVFNGELTNSISYNNSVYLHSTVYLHTHNPKFLTSYSTWQHKNKVNQTKPLRQETATASLSYSPALERIMWAGMIAMTRPAATPAEVLSEASTFFGGLTVVWGGFRGGLG